jgi:putative PIN family toxin of toxin-antitoxin system
MRRAVADTNVLVAAAISPAGSCGRMPEAALDRRRQLVASPQLIAELGEALFREKFQRWLREDEVSQFVAGVRTLADVVADPPAATEAATADPKDEFLAALAQAANVTALISGDPHLTDREERNAIAVASNEPFSGWSETVTDPGSAPPSSTA